MVNEEEEEEKEEDKEEASERQQRSCFSAKKYEWLANTWLNISKISTVGVQKRLTFWTNIEDNYNKYHERHLKKKDWSQLKYRQQKINESCKQFLTCYKQTCQRKKNCGSKSDII